jgi:NADH-quinone oxidoreductase subunit L
LYVIAWLLPFASFTVLVLGGKRWGKVGAVVACVAIIGSFALSLIGLFTYVGEFAPGFFPETGEAHSDSRGAHYVVPDQEPGHEPGAQAGHAAPEHPVSHGADDHVAAKRGEWKWDFSWIRVGNRQFRLGFYVDSLTVIMFSMITLIASAIHIFSAGYMHEELHDPVHDPLAVPPGEPPLHRTGRFPRFFTYLSLFCFSMLGLVLADNVFMVFMFWELVGLCSYLLIGFYYERKSASTAANKAFITNRVGDAGFIVGLMIIWTSVGTFNIQDAVHTVRDSAGQIVRVGASTGERVFWDAGAGEWLAEVGESGKAAVADTLGPVQLFSPQTGLPGGTMGYALLTVAGIGVFIGCVGKSAQFPLHVWLPDAMEGPTPVSALIHAATMVAAGVYLVGRFYAFFTPEALLVIAYTGGITLFLAGTIALVMTDIKRVLAYSTVSQLGYMMLGLGVGGWAAGLFHLLTHAFFKALLFLGSGSVIHGTGTQEMPQMGGLWKKMPITMVTMLVGVLAICGIPLFSGYYSKDAIVAQALYFGGPLDWGGRHQQHMLLFLLPTVGAGITAFYMFRLFFMTFTGETRDHHVAEHAHESTVVMWAPLAVLAVFSVIVGYGFNGKTPLLERVLTFSAPHAVLAHAPREVHDRAGMIALAVVLGGIGMSSLFYFFRVLDPSELVRQFPRLHDFLLHKWYFDELYDAVLVRPVLAAARFCRGFDWNVLDRFIDGTARCTVRVSRADGWFDNRIVDGAVNFVADWVYATGAWLRRMQTGQLRQYIVFLAVAVIGLFTLISYIGRMGPNLFLDFLAK